jgi:hypothetical protein
MTERLTLLITLELAIARSSIQRRTDMLLQLADLFLHGSTRLTENQIIVIDEVITRVATEVDASVRALLAKRLARIGNAPINLTRMLAADNDVQVAYPILAHSDRIDEATLLYSARTTSQKHLLAISWRKSLSEKLSDMLLERGNRQVVLSTAKNRGARFSDSGFRLLIERSGSDDVLAALLGSRPDILTLLTSVPEASRKKLAENPHVRHEIDRAIVLFVDQFQDHAHAEMPGGGATHILQHGTVRHADENIPSFVVEENFEEDEPSVARVDNVPDGHLAHAAATGQRRRTARQKSFLRGCIYFNNRRSSVECLIRDISHLGARILISGSVNIPDVVDLYIPQKEQTLQARVEWRQEDEIGLSFVRASSAAGERSPPQELTQRMAQLESEIASLRGVITRAKTKPKTNRDSDPSTDPINYNEQRSDLEQKRQ